MRLDEYRRKRDFSKTAEPAPGARPDAHKGAASFVVQKHAASHLHYDFRLELGGVLKSWAVPKGPSLRAGERRLAVEVEDHPLAYGGFEGTIAEGLYGGGKVIVWDNGTWRPDGDPRVGIAEGKLRFTLEGQKLAGGFSLIRMARKAGGKPQWLLVKGRDGHERPADAPEVTEELTKSVLSGREVDEVGEDAPRATKAATAAKRGRPSAPRATTDVATRRTTARSPAKGVGRARASGATGTKGRAAAPSAKTRTARAKAAK